MVVITDIYDVLVFLCGSFLQSLEDEFGNVSCQCRGMSSRFLLMTLVLLLLCFFLHFVSLQVIFLCCITMPVCFCLTRKTNLMTTLPSRGVEIVGILCIFKTCLQCTNVTNRDINRCLHCEQCDETLRC